MTFIEQYLLPLKAGAAIALLVGLVAWHAHAVHGARVAGREDAEAVCAESARLAKVDADNRLEDQRTTASQALTDYTKANQAADKRNKARQNELRKATTDLAACKLNADTIRLLNDARAGTAGDNRPAVADPAR